MWLAPLKESLEFIAYEATWDDVPATTIESCGNYRDHSLFTAKEWCKDILAKGISSDRSNAALCERYHACAVGVVVWTAGMLERGTQSN